MRHQSEQYFSAVEDQVVQQQIHNIQLHTTLAQLNLLHFSAAREQAAVRGRAAVYRSHVAAQMCDHHSISDRQINALTVIEER